VDVGAYYPESRSQHKCQGMGTMSERGTSIEYFEHLKGERATKDIFEGINTSWTRIGGEGKAIDIALQEVADKFDAKDPAASVSDLLSVSRKIGLASDSYYADLKIKEIEHIIKCGGS